jgi:flagellar biogenesis protein FliO
LFSYRNKYLPAIILAFWLLLYANTSAVFALQTKTAEKQLNSNFVSQKTEAGVINAEVQGTELKNVLKTENSKEPSFLNILSSLITVVILIIVTGWIYLKLSKLNPNLLMSGKFKQAKNDTINILATASLGQGRSVHLIEVGDKKLVIGSSNNSVTVLSEISKEEKAENINKNAINNDFSENNLQKEDSFSTGADIYREYLQ